MYPQASGVGKNAGPVHYRTRDFIQISNFAHSAISRGEHPIARGRICILVCRYGPKICIESLHKIFLFFLFFAQPSKQNRFRWRRDIFYRRIFGAIKWFRLNSSRLSSFRNIRKHKMQLFSADGCLDNFTLDRTHCGYY